MSDVEFVKPSRFFKTFLFYYIGIYILLWIFNEIFGIDNFIRSKLIDVITIENTTALYITMQVCTFIIGMCISAFIIWISIKKTYEEKMVKIEDVKTLVKYFLTFYIIILVLNNILIFYTERLQPTISMELLNISQSLMTTMDISTGIAGLVISIFFFRKFLSDKVKNGNNSLETKEVN